jgi:chromate reductase, NAD(P)H dehydrogenase (quinone)
VGSRPLLTAVTGTRILGVSGSLQASSTNGALLRIARERVGGDAELVVFDALGDIPPFSPEIALAPAAVDAWSALVSSSDALLFATPEYAHGLPGVLKNALDWLVGSGELYGKRVAILSAAPSAERGAHARADLERTLCAQGADVLASTTIAVRASARGHEEADAGIVAGVDDALRVLIDAAGAGPNDPTPTNVAPLRISSANP